MDILTDSSPPPLHTIPCSPPQDKISRSNVEVDGFPYHESVCFCVDTKSISMTLVQTKPRTWDEDSAAWVTQHFKAHEQSPTASIGDDNILHNTMEGKNDFSFMLANSMHSRAQVWVYWKGMGVLERYGCTGYPNEKVCVRNLKVRGKLWSNDCGQIACSFRHTESTP